MAVQKSRKTPSRRGMRRSHDALTGPTLAVDATTGVTHRRHHVTADGFYRGKKVFEIPQEAEQESSLWFRVAGDRPVSHLDRLPLLSESQGHNRLGRHGR